MSFRQFWESFVSDLMKDELEVPLTQPLLLHYSDFGYNLFEWKGLR